MQKRSNGAIAVCVVAILWIVATAMTFAQGPADIVINDSQVFPESLTSARDGRVFVGSIGKSTVYRAAPQAKRADAWIQPAGTGLRTVLGVFADDRANALWVCSTVAQLPGSTEPPPPGDTTLKRFDLTTGALKDSYVFPGGGICNDIAVARDGTTYVTDTRDGRVLRLKKGASTLDVWTKDPLLASADGIAILADGAVYVNTVMTSTLVRVPVTPDGTAGPLVKLETSRPIMGPDGMRSVGRNTMLLVEGGRLDEVTINGNRAEIRVLKEGLDSATAVTLVGNTAYVVQAKFPYMSDPALKGKDPGTFSAIAVPYRAQR